MQKFTSSLSFGKIRSSLPTISIILIVAIALILIGVLFYVYGRSMMETQLKERLRNTAALAALDINGDEIEKIKAGATFESSPELRTIVRKLNAVRDSISNIESVYILRKSSDPTHHEFVADVDLLSTQERLDKNKDGIVDASEAPAEPGELYDWTPFPKLGTEAFQFPTVDDSIGTDKWGPTISGYAPIRASDGRIVATIGIDMSANDFIKSTRNLFSPVALLLVLFAAVSIGSGSVLFLWRRRVELLQRLEIERSGLLRLAFHQLGGPLTIISWSIEELEQEGPASIQRPIANIQEGVTRLMGILKTLKDADQVHAGKLDYKPELISLSSILEKVVKEAGAKLAMHRQTVTLELDPSIFINLDSKLIAGVAQELLTNASDFSPEKSEIIIRSRKTGTYAEFEVEDHGHGIPKHDLPRIFGEFTRGSNATKYKADGNGLGLYIIKGIVERAGGTIKIDSMEGKGTKVTVKLKMA